MVDELYNPMLIDEDFDANATYTEVSIPKKTNVIRLYPVSGTKPQVFINSKDNKPSVKVYEALTLTNHDGRVRVLYVYGAAAVTVNVKCITVPRGEIVRVGVDV